MKKVLIIFLTVIAGFFSADSVNAGIISFDCTCNGIFLGGKVQVVDSAPDFKVKKVSTFQDLSVKKVESLSVNSKCGVWQFVESSPDFKIQYVDEAFPDFTIKFVEKLPGLR